MWESLSVRCALTPETQPYSSIRYGLATVRCTGRRQLKRHRRTRKTKQNKKCRPKNVWKIFRLHITIHICIYIGLRANANRLRNRYFYVFCVLTLFTFRRRRCRCRWRSMGMPFASYPSSVVRRQWHDRQLVLLLSRLHRAHYWTKSSNLKRWQSFRFHNKIDNIHRYILWRFCIDRSKSVREVVESNWNWSMRRIRKYWTCLDAWQHDICWNWQSIMMMTTELKWNECRQWPSSTSPLAKCWLHRVRRMVTASFSRIPWGRMCVLRCAFTDC